MPRRRPWPLPLRKRRPRAARPYDPPGRSSRAVPDRSLPEDPARSRHRARRAVFPAHIRIFSSHTRPTPGSTYPGRLTKSRTNFSRRPPITEPARTSISPSMPVRERCRARCPRAVWGKGPADREAAVPGRPARGRGARRREDRWPSTCPASIFPLGERSSLTRSSATGLWMPAWAPLGKARSAYPFWWPKTAISWPS